VERRVVCSSRNVALPQREERARIVCPPSESKEAPRAQIPTKSIGKKGVSGTIFVGISHSIDSRSAVSHSNGPLDGAFQPAVARRG